MCLGLSLGLPVPATTYMCVHLCGCLPLCQGKKGGVGSEYLAGHACLLVQVCISLTLSVSICVNQLSRHVCVCVCTCVWIRSLCDCVSLPLKAHLYGVACPSECTCMHAWGCVSVSPDTRICVCLSISLLVPISRCLSVGHTTTSATASVHSNS